jgi:tetratricopeptide (TPR) repeat protein
MSGHRLKTTLGLALLVGCQPAPSQPAPAAQESAPASTAPEPVEPTRPASGREFSAELAALDGTIAAVLRRAEAQPQGWLVLERAADLYLTRARLSGDYSDYERAEAALARAFAIAGEGAGPVLTQARLEFTLHRLGRAAARLAETDAWKIRTPADQRRIAALRADLAFQQGRYADALAGFEAALAAERSLTNLARLAQYRWKTGDFADAEALYREALGQLRGEGGEEAAWLNLMLGLMDLDRGRYADALVHYRDAEAALSGYWLIDEHIAEVLALQGKTADALALYQDIIARTDNPEFMDAVAAIHLEAGRADEARAMIARARARYEAQLERYPEAAYGHALEHFLEFGDDPARVVELAEANHRTRPNAEAKISLARAYLKAGRTDAARAVIEDALATPWNTADLHATAAEVFTAAGDPARAASERERALALNPDALKG